MVYLSLVVTVVPGQRDADPSVRVIGHERAVL